MFLKINNFGNIQNKRTKNAIIFLAAVLILSSNFNEIFGQNGKTITDFYDYANKEWIDSTVIPEHSTVVNNWGILWDKIINQSIEILADNSNYDLDANHDFVLNQLQNFYKSTIEYSDDNRKRVELVQEYYPMLYGILFSKITVSQSKEEKIKEIIKFLTTAYRTKINDSKLIGNYYKEFFLSKLDKMEFEIGSPALSDFPGMPILSANSFEKNIQLSKAYQVEKDKNKYDWKSAPFETDCYYNFNDNKVKIYAGILYDSYSAEENNIVYLFATIGRTISHEMTHAFDNIGKDYDKNGEYINWFEKLFSGALFSKNDWDNVYDVLIKQYNQYTIQDSLFVNGEKTLQENIADLGGIEISLLALKLYLKDNHPVSFEKEKSELIKKYFITYAQYWREKTTPEFERYSLNRLHTPQKFRVIGPVYNQNEFYEVFNIDKMSKYYIPEYLRVKIW